MVESRYSFWMALSEPFASQAQPIPRLISMKAPEEIPDQTQDASQVGTVALRSTALTQELPVRFDFDSLSRHLFWFPRTYASR
jgi:hypothetical protein